MTQTAEEIEALRIEKERRARENMERMAQEHLFEEVSEGEIVGRSAFKFRLSPSRLLEPDLRR